VRHKDKAWKIVQSFNQTDA